MTDQGGSSVSQDSTNTPTPKDELVKLLTRLIDVTLDEDAQSIEPEGTVAVADALIGAGWRPSAANTETEWAFRYYDGHTSYPMSEERARRCASNDSSAVVLRRSVGPWEEQL